MKLRTCFAALALCGAIQSLAQSPEAIPYQGTIATSSGDPYTGSFDFSFAIQDGSAISLWSSGTLTLAVELGAYSVVLGEAPQPAIPDSIWKLDSLFLSIDFDDGASGAQTLMPALPLLPVPFAHRAYISDNYCGEALNTDSISTRIIVAQRACIDTLQTDVILAKGDPKARLELDSLEMRLIIAEGFDNDGLVFSNTGLEAIIAGGRGSFIFDTSNFVLGLQTIKNIGVSASFTREFDPVNGQIRTDRFLDSDGVGRQTDYDAPAREIREFYSSPQDSTEIIIRYNPNAQFIGYDNVNAWSHGPDLDNPLGPRLSQTRFGGVYTQRMFSPGGEVFMLMDLGMDKIVLDAHKVILESGMVEIAGDLMVGGMLLKGGGSFKIDHPQDPLNKYLVHSFVESPEMMNVYNGNVTTDERGEAVVKLPSYFESLNMDFRYQLTVIGEFAQAIVRQEIADNRFKVATDKPNVKVSWQVTGVRNDPWARQNRIEVEQDKEADMRGKLLHEEALQGRADDLTPTNH